MRSGAQGTPGVTQRILESGLHRISAAAMPEEAGSCSEHCNIISYRAPLRKGPCSLYANLSDHAEISTESPNSCER